MIIDTDRSGWIDLDDAGLCNVLAMVFGFCGRSPSSPMHQFALLVEDDRRKTAMLFGC